MVLSIGVNRYGGGLDAAIIIAQVLGYRMRPVGDFTVVEYVRDFIASPC